MKEILYRQVELPSDEPVQFVGCYVLKWGKVKEPTVGFVEVEEFEIDKVADNCMYDFPKSYTHAQILAYQKGVDKMWSKIKT